MGHRLLCGTPEFVAHGLEEWFVAGAAHARRKFFDLARINQTPIAAEEVERIDVLFAMEREIKGMAPRERVRVEAGRSSSCWIAGYASSAGASPKAATPASPSITASSAGPRSLAFSPMGGSACRTTPPSGSCVLLRSDVQLAFAGSDEGGRRAAAIYTLIATATLNDVDPQAWIADVLACPITPPGASTNSFHGIGVSSTSPIRLPHKHSYPRAFTGRVLSIHVRNR
jgi:hypothetical protein